MNYESKIFNAVLFFKQTTTGTLSIAISATISNDSFASTTYSDEWGRPCSWLHLPRSSPASPCFPRDSPRSPRWANSSCSSCSSATCTPRSFSCPCALSAVPLRASAILTSRVGSCFSHANVVNVVSRRRRRVQRVHLTRKVATKKEATVAATAATRSKQNKLNRKRQTIKILHLTYKKCLHAYRVESNLSDHHHNKEINKITYTNNNII